jgi:hypothetical protein
MSKFLASVATAASLIAQLSAAAAAPFSYICTIQSYHNPEGPTAGVVFFGELAMETTMAIDRRTGAIIHPVLGNTAYRKTTVLDFGDKEWSFKALSESGHNPNEPNPIGGNTVYIEVAEFTDAIQKPFIVVQSGTVYLGYCE